VTPTIRAPYLQAYSMTVTGALLLAAAGYVGNSMFSYVVDGGMLPLDQAPWWTPYISILGWSAAALVTMLLFFVTVPGIGTPGSSRRLGSLSCLLAGVLLFAGAVLPMLKAAAAI
jgi:hypothetical protein